MGLFLLQDKNYQVFVKCFIIFSGFCVNASARIYNCNSSKRICLQKFKKRYNLRTELFSRLKYLIVLEKSSSNQGYHINL